MAALVPAAISLAIGIALFIYLQTGAPQALTVGEAVMRRAPERLLELIRAGADPQQRIDASLWSVAGGRRLSLSPLAVAAARGDRDLMVILMRAGVAWSDRERREASCLAALSDHKAMAQSLMEPAPSKEVCRAEVARLDADLVPASRPRPIRGGSGSDRSSSVPAASAPD